MRFRVPASIRSHIARHPDVSGCSRPPTRRHRRRDRRTGFEADPLRERLVQSGLDLFRPVFASWLGVTRYLTREAIAASLPDLGRFAPGSEIVADPRLPAELHDTAESGYTEAVTAGRTRPALADLLRAAGFEVLETAAAAQSGSIGTSRSSGRPSRTARVTAAFPNRSRTASSALSSSVAR